MSRFWWRWIVIDFTSLNLDLIYWIFNLHILWPHKIACIMPIGSWLSHLTLNRNYWNAFNLIQNWIYELRLDCCWVLRVKFALKASGESIVNSTYSPIGQLNEWWIIQARNRMFNKIDKFDLSEPSTFDQSVELLQIELYRIVVQSIESIIMLFKTHILEIWN